MFIFAKVYLLYRTVQHFTSHIRVRFFKGVIIGAISKLRFYMILHPTFHRNPGLAFCLNDCWKISSFIYSIAGFIYTTVIYIGDRYVRNRQRKPTRGYAIAAEVWISLYCSYTEWTVKILGILIKKNINNLVKHVNGYFY